MSDALDQAETALVAALDAIRAAKVADVASTRRLMPLKTAAHALGVSEKTARRRAKAGAGVPTTKGWLLDIAAAGEMGRRA